MSFHWDKQDWTHYPDSRERHVVLGIRIMDTCILIPRRHVVPLGQTALVQCCLSQWNDMSSRNQDNVSNPVFPVERHVVPLGQTALDTLFDSEKTCLLGIRIMCPILFSEKTCRSTGTNRIGHIILIPRRHVVPLGQTSLDTSNILFVPVERHVFTGIRIMCPILFVQRRHVVHWNQDNWTHYPDSEKTCLLGIRIMVTLSCFPSGTTCRSNQDKHVDTLS